MICHRPLDCREFLTAIQQALVPERVEPFHEEIERDFRRYLNRVFTGHHVLLALPTDYESLPPADDLGCNALAVDNGGSIPRNGHSPLSMELVPVIERTNHPSFQIASPHVSRPGSSYRRRTSAAPPPGGVLGAFTREASTLATSRTPGTAAISAL